MPTPEEMLAEAAAVEAEIAAGGRTYTVQEALAHIRETLREVAPRRLRISAPADRDMTRRVEYLSGVRGEPFAR